MHMVSPTGIKRYAVAEERVLRWEQHVDRTFMSHFMCPCRWSFMPCPLGLIGWVMSSVYIPGVTPVTPQVHDGVPVDDHECSAKPILAPFLTLS